MRTQRVSRALVSGFFEPRAAAPGGSIWSTVRVLFGVLLVVLATPLGAQEIDDRVTSVSYWQELLGLGLVPPNSEEPSPSPVATGTVIQSQGLVQDAPDVAITTAGNTTQSENSVFIDPQDSNVLLNSNNSSDFPVSFIFGASHFTSLDGAQSWQGSITGVGGNNRGDPAAAIDSNGRFYVGYIAADLGQGVAHSDDQGQTFTHVQVAPNPGSIAPQVPGGPIRGQIPEIPVRSWHPVADTSAGV